MHARLRADTAPDDPRLGEALRTFEGRAWLHPLPGGSDLVLVRDVEEPERPRWWLHALLLALTLLTTHMAGALLAGVDPMNTAVVRLGGWRVPYPTDVDWGELARGAPFALSLMGILLAHESGHYVAARLHGVRVTPPFFIPFPAYWSIVGTLGAFIRIKGPTVRRSVLFDIGVAGPWASFLLSLPVFGVGLLLSSPAAGSVDPWTPFVIRFAGEPVWIGTGPVLQALAALRFPEALGEVPILLHPLAFSGWLGLFLTSLNLLPLGQLDGGHVLYALEPRVQGRVARLFLLSLLPLGFLWWGWWFWAVAAFLVNRGRMAHPPVLQPQVPLDSRRRLLAWGAILVFFLTFVPVPVDL